MAISKEEFLVKTIKDDDSGLKLVYTSGETDPYKLTSEYFDYVFKFSKGDLLILKRIIDAMLNDDNNQ